ncbi:MAG: peptidylprolyl isomerase [Alphaproteobacteria bacterium]|nr:peptidylprolyl isomerase [Alphaproteobacteria bacterium]
MQSPENRVVLKLDAGEVLIQLRPDWALNHVKRIKELVRAGFYDGLLFHRVIEGFMAQTGCPDGNGMGGSGKRIKAEFNDQPHDRGVCSMARAMDVNSADSQFFICLKNAHFLDGEYTAWGKVIEGMEHVDGIARGEPPARPDRIVSMHVLADITS